MATTTSPSWAPAFQKIKAAVTDVGGVMCHAAIVCRDGRPSRGSWNRLGNIEDQDRPENQGERIYRGNRYPLMSRCGGGSSDGHLQFVLPFEECDLSMVATVGGKCASLGELMKARIPVPPGFAITTDTYELFLDENGLTQGVIDETEELGRNQGR